MKDCDGHELRIGDLVSVPCRIVLVRSSYLEVRPALPGGVQADDLFDLDPQQVVFTSRPEQADEPK